MSASNSTLTSLRQSLLRLHAELGASHRLDQASKDLLREVLGDIERVLREEQPLTQAPRSSLEALAARFDAGHPTLSASLREFVDLLGRAGL